jgi:DNA repair photolyase
VPGWKGWERVRIDPVSGEVVDRDSPESLEAIAPLIISASRSTDIPAFYGDWFSERLLRGYATWINPFSGTAQHVSFARARVFVFWTKDPRPFLPALRDLVREGRQVQVLFTVNDYIAEGLEPGLPPLADRIDVFHEVSKIVGKGRLSWRFDPVLLSDTLTVERVMDRMGEIGDLLSGRTSRLVFSFIELERYPRVRRNLAACGAGGVREPSVAEETVIARRIAEMNEEWGLALEACGEGRDFSSFGIGKAGCISADILAREFPEDTVLQDFLSSGPGGRRPKDPGQRKTCGCVPSKDIGRYSTCMHLCRYCYANSSAGMVGKNYAEYRRLREERTDNPSIIR